MDWILFLGIATGMRCMTPMAVMCWFMWLAMLPVSRLNFWTANIISVIVFMVFALGEFYGDTLPKTPSRKSTGPLVARLVFGAAIGMLVVSSFGEPLAGGFILGVVGALIGTYGGYRARMYFAGLMGNDLPVAVFESVLAVAISVAAMHHICGDWAWQQHEAMVVVRAFWG
jgi:uncharacterized membrane protein